MIKQGLSFICAALLMSSHAYGDVISSSLITTFDAGGPLVANLNTSFGGQDNVTSWAVFDNSGVGPANTKSGGTAVFGNIGSTVGGSLAGATVDSWNFTFSDPTSPAPGSGGIFGHTIDWNFTVGGPVSMSLAITPNVGIGDSGAVRVYGETQTDVLGGTNFLNSNNITINGIGNAAAGDQSFVIPNANTSATWIYEFVFDNYQGETINFTITQPTIGGFDPESAIAGVAIATIPEPATATLTMTMLAGLLFVRRRRK